MIIIIKFMKEKVINRFKTKNKSKQDFLFQLKQELK